MKELNILVTTTEFNMKYWKGALEKRKLSLDYSIVENTAGGLFELYDNSLDTKDEEELTIGFAGRYCEWKNWPLAIEICKKLNSILNEKLHVKMAVGCLDENAEEDSKIMFNDLERLLGNRFEGEINIKMGAMNKFYYDIDIFVLTSNYNTESFGRTLVEAMSRKSVVLTTNSGGSVEVVGNLDNVCNNADEFVNRILEFHYNKRLMNSEKEKNMLRVKEKYSLKNNVEKHLNLYRSIIWDSKDPLKNAKYLE